MVITYSIVGEFLLGLIIGGAVVGSSTQRTIYSGKGDIKFALIYNSINFFSYMASIYFIVGYQYTAIIGNLIGSSISVFYIARSHMRKKEQEEFRAKIYNLKDVKGKK